MRDPHTGHAGSSAWGRVNLSLGPAALVAGAVRNGEHVIVRTSPAESPGVSDLDGPATLALRGMADELRSRGIDAWEDGVCGIVHAGPMAQGRRAVLRPHRGDLWWWMRWSLQEGTAAVLPGVPLSPASRTSDAARRIMGVMSAAEGC